MTVQCQVFAKAALPSRVRSHIPAHSPALGAGHSLTHCLTLGPGRLCLTPPPIRRNASLNIRENSNLPVPDLASGIAPHQRVTPVGAIVYGPFAPILWGAKTETAKEPDRHV